MPGERTRELAAIMPPQKLARKQRATMLGIALVVLGSAMIFWSYRLTMQKEFDKWLFAPMAFGVLLVFYGGYNISGEVARAFVGDVVSGAVKLRKGGSGGD